MFLTPTSGVGINKKTDKVSESAISNLFLLFDKPVKISALEVSSPDFQMPQFEVKQFDSRFAIVVFSDRLPAGTLVIRVQP